MEPLIMEAQNREPSVNFDGETGQLLLAGRSIPENSYELYKPLLEWMHNYCHKPASHTKLDIKLIYFNSSSAEYILELLKQLEGIYQRGNSAEVNWYYEADDEDMQLIGEDFASMVDVPITKIPITRDNDADDDDEL